MIKLNDLMENDSLCPMAHPKNIEPVMSSYLRYHIDNKISLSENIFRTYSESYFDLIEEVRTLYYNNQIELCDEQIRILYYCVFIVLAFAKDNKTRLQFLLC